MCISITLYSTTIGKTFPQIREEQQQAELQKKQEQEKETQRTIRMINAAAEVLKACIDKNNL